MNMSMLLFFSDEDEAEDGSDEDAERHEGLLKSIGMLDGRGGGKQREVTELVAESEYNLGKTKVGEWSVTAYESHGKGMKWHSVWRC